MIEAAIYQCLQALAGGQVFSGLVPGGTVAPYIAIHKISGARDFAFAGATGARRQNVQVDCYATNRLDALLVAESVFAALSDPGTGLAIGPVLELPDEYDPPSGLHRVSAEYTIQT